jgi:hypothetical protein
VDYLKEIPSEEQPAVKTRFSPIEELLYMLNRFNFVSKYSLNKCVVQLEKEGMFYSMNNRCMLLWKI